MDLITNNEHVKLNPFDKNNLDLIKGWYDQVNSYGFATGGKEPEETVLKQSYTSFVSGIYPAYCDNCIGLVSGEYKTFREPLLWIRSFFIDRLWQRKRFGTYAYQLLAEFFYCHYYTKRVYVSVSSDNKTGIAFWDSLGFHCVKGVKFAEPYNGRAALIFEKVIE